MVGCKQENAQEMMGDEPDLDEEENDRAGSEWLPRIPDHAVIAMAVVQPFSDIPWPAERPVFCFCCCATPL